MASFVIDGGNRLTGSLEIKSAKNSVLVLMSASILTQEKVVLNNCPDISDVHNMLGILSSLGCTTSFVDGKIEIVSPRHLKGEITQSLASMLRSSIFLLGAMLARTCQGKFAYPGGCNIGARPVDIHLDGLRKLGIRVKETSEYIFCDAKRAKSGYVRLALPSVGATENLMMASVFLKGKTVIENCAKEPEIVDLQDMLVAMGAKIKGAGSYRIEIDGVDSLHGVQYTPIPDRIVAGTYMIGTAMTGGEVEFGNVRVDHLEALVSKMPKYTCNFIYKDDRIILQSKGRHTNNHLVETWYYPYFPTDLQTQFLALQCVGKGVCVIVENIFESRYNAVEGLVKMGADIIVRDRVAVVRGVPKLYGRDVWAGDLRGGASLVLAGLVAQDSTVVHDIFHIDRGYEDMSNILTKLGAKIKRIE